MYQFLNKVRKEGLLSVEMDVEKPSESGIFKNFPESWPIIPRAILCATRYAWRSLAVLSLSIWTR